MARVVLVGYGKMLYSLIEGISKTSNQILGVFRNDRIRYNSFELFFKDMFNPSMEKTIINSKKLYDIKGSSVNSDKFYNEIARLNPDMIIVGSWGERLRSDILSLVPCINFHPALLPKNRGANPYFWVIYNNQKVSGLTIHYMNERFDRGDIILQEAITIAPNETGFSLKEKTTKLAQVMVQDFLELYNKGQIQPIKQQEEFATYENQLTTKETILDLNKPKEFNERHLRALYPWASGYIHLGRKYVEVKSYQFLELDEDNKNKKNYEIIEKTSKYYLVKGLDFLIKVFR